MEEVIDVKEENAPIFKSALKDGAVVGLVGIVFIVITYLTGDIYSGKSWITWVGMLVSVLLIYYFTDKYRKESCGEFLTYGRAFSYGWVTYFISGIISVLFMLILQNVIEPNFAAKMAEYQTQMLSEKGMSDAQIKQALEMAKKFSGPLMTFVFGIVGSAFFGLVISLITAIFAKKNRPVFE